MRGLGKGSLVKWPVAMEWLTRTNGKKGAGCEEVDL